MQMQTLLNGVLTSLRATQDVIPTGATALSTTYQSLLLQFFNEVKEEVEQACNWRSLYQTINVTVPANALYAAIPGTNERSRLVRQPIIGGGMGQSGFAPSLASADRIVPLVFDITTPSQSSNSPLDEMALNLLLYSDTATNSQATAQPGRFAIGQGNTDNGLAGAQEAVLYISPRCTTIRTIQVTMVVPQGDFITTDVARTINVPTYPITLGLQWRARMEKGEELGPNSAYSEQNYRSALDSAVGIEEAEKGNSMDLMLT